MHLGILQCGHVPDEVASTDGPYATLIGSLFAHRGFSQSLWSVVDGDFPDGPEAADGWLVTGSKHGAYEDHPWIPPLEALLRAIHGAGRPLVGICFGHQIIAQALGGTVVKYPEGWAIGATEIAVDDRHVTLNSWHQDQVVALPDGSKTLAQTSFCDHAILAHGPRTLTVQAHPEFPNSVVETLIETRGDTVPAPLIDQAKAKLTAANDNRLLADWLADVLEGADAQQVTR